MYFNTFAGALLTEIQTEKHGMYPMLRNSGLECEHRVPIGPTFAATYEGMPEKM